jgi:hypothetical protein
MVTSSVNLQKGQIWYTAHIRYGHLEMEKGYLHYGDIISQLTALWPLYTVTVRSPSGTWGR